MASSEILVQPDWEIIGFVSSGFIGIIVILPISLHVLTKKHHRSETSHLFYATLISLMSALIFCTVVALFRTNLFFDFDYSISSFPCQIFLWISGSFYILSKFAMYITFTYRIEIVFGSSIYAVNPVLLRWIRRFLMFTFPLFVLPIHFTAKQEIETPNHSLSLCTYDVGSSDDDGTAGIGRQISNITAALFVFSDAVCCLLFLWIFNHKLNVMSKSYAAASQRVSVDQRTLTSMQQIESQLIKQTILVCSSICSTIWFAFIGSFVLWSIGWFIPLDMTINSLSIYLMYHFANRSYGCLCCPCTWCCRYCITHCYGVKDDQLFIDLAVPSASNSDSRASTNSLDAVV